MVFQVENKLFYGVNEVLINFNNNYFYCVRLTSTQKINLYSLPSYTQHLSSRSNEMGSLTTNVG